MRRVLQSALFLFSACIAFTPSVVGQSANISSLTAISPSNSSTPVPIFSIGRIANVVTVSTTDPTNTDRYAEQSNRIGAIVQIAGVAVDPSNAVNGSFPICGPPTPGCVMPTTYTYSFLSPGQNFSVSGSAQLGLTSVNHVGCPLIPTGYFSFCGDSYSGGGLAYAGDGSLVEFIATADYTGSMLWASSLADGNTGSTRATGCETGFIESGNEWILGCFYKRQYAGAIDIDMKNALFVIDVGDGATGATAGEFTMSGTRQAAVFGTHNNRVLQIDMGATPSGVNLPSTGTLRVRNGSSVCWQNVEESASLCQSTNVKDSFTFDNSVTTPAYFTATNCTSFQGQCGNAAAGSVAFPPESTSINIYTSVVTQQSQIFVQEDSSLGTLLGIPCNQTVGRTYQITGRTPGVGFRVTTNATPNGAAACLSYHIVN
ncbi:MAG TPA: hypothetical protein VKT53_10615 [Candidatus Acidoferrum sp.]|nr:hypothetical protein [Candidatus Acidoferrum sp.]